MGKQITYEERDQLDSYKAKDYAQNYDKVTGGTSRDQENYRTSKYGGDFSRGLGEEVPQGGNLNQKQKSTATVNKQGEIVMSEAELQAQIEMYERLSNQHKGSV